MERINIDSVDYPLLHSDREPGWETVQQGEPIRYSWEDGFSGGMGEYARRSVDGYYVSNGFDPSTKPYLRLPPSFTTIEFTPTGTDFATSGPVYVFIAQDGNGADYAYILNLAVVWKIKLSTNTIVNKRTFSSGVAGRPTLFEGYWYIPLGEAGGGPNVRALTAITTDTSNDTWTDKGYQALHLTTVMDGATAKLVVAQGNAIKLSGDGSTLGDAFEVGESSEDITDLHSWMGEVAVVKPSNVYRFNPNGNSVPLLDFPGKQLGMSSWNISSSSDKYGPYFYWPHTSLTRIIGDLARAIDPASQRDWATETLDSFTPFASLSAYSSYNFWTSVQVWNRWLYASHGQQVYYSYILEDGSADWHGCLYVCDADAIHPARIALSDGPKLWIFERGGSNAYAHYIDLHHDGSLRTAFGSNRGAVSTNYQFWLPLIDGGPGLANINKQWRKMWVRLEGTVDAKAPWQLAAHLNGAASSTNVGTTITSSGYSERAWTVGTNDRAYFIRPTIKCAAGASYTPSSDSRLRAFGVEGVSPMVYRARIDLRPAALRDYGKSWESALKNLRDLTAGTAVSIIPPGQKDGAAFTGYIVGRTEHLQGEGPDMGYVLDLLIQRYDWDGA